MANLNYRKSPSRFVTITVPLVVIAISLISVSTMAIVVPATGYNNYNTNSLNEQHQIHYRAQRPPTTTTTAQPNALDPIHLLCKFQFSSSGSEFITMKPPNDKSTIWTQRIYHCHKFNGLFLNNYFNPGCSHQKNATLKLVTSKRQCFCCVRFVERLLDSPHFWYYDDDHVHSGFNSHCKVLKNYGDLMVIKDRRKGQSHATVKPQIMTTPTDPSVSTHADSKPMAGLSKTGVETAAVNQMNKNLASTKATEAKQTEIKKPNQTEPENHTKNIPAGMPTVTVTVNVTTAKAPEQNQNQTGTGAVSNQGVGVSNSTSTSGENSIEIDGPKEPKSTSVVTVFAYNNFEGPSTPVKIYKDCKTLPLDWQKRISSINTHGTCVEVCQYSNCDEPCFNVAPGTLGHNRLRDVNFDKRIISMRACSTG